MKLFIKFHKVMEIEIEIEFIQNLPLTIKTFWQLGEKWLAKFNDTSGVTATRLHARCRCDGPTTYLETHVSRGCIATVSPLAPRPPLNHYYALISRPSNKTTRTSLIKMTQRRGCESAKRCHLQPRLPRITTRKLEQRAEHKDDGKPLCVWAHFNSIIIP